MRTLSLALLAGIVLVMTSGCEGKNTQADEFDKLFRDYSTRYHDTMIRQTPKTLEEVIKTAVLMWEQTFDSHPELVTAKCQDILDNLPLAAPVDESQFDVVATQDIPADTDKPKVEGEILMKHVVWNPISTAGIILNTFLRGKLSKSSVLARETFVSNVPLFWEVTDRNVDAPKLVQREGPFVFVIHMVRKDGSYRVTHFSWLQPKDSNFAKKMPAPEAGKEAPAADTPATETPAKEAPAADVGAKG